MDDLESLADVALRSAWMIILFFSRREFFLHSRDFLGGLISSQQKCACIIQGNKFREHIKEAVKLPIP